MTNVKSMCILLIALVGHIASAQTQKDDSNIPERLIDVSELAKNSQTCAVASVKYDGFGVCFTGSPSMLQAEVTCDEGKSVFISLEDPNYYSCPPAQLIEPNLKNNSVSKEGKASWEALHTEAKKMRISPYTLFRIKIIQSVQGAGLQLKETQTQNIRSDLSGTDMLSLFNRR